MDVIILDLGTTIKGNCTHKGFVDKIECYSFSESVSIPMNTLQTSTERTIGRAVVSEMQMTKMTDLATPDMFQYCAKGQKIGDTATISIGRIENGAFMLTLKYVLTNPMISHISTSGGGGSPSDSFSLNFTKISIEYTQQNPDSTKKGTTSGVWNLATNESA